MDALYAKLTQQNIRSVKGCPIGGYSTFRIGGTARLAVFPKGREELLRALSYVTESGARYAVVGRGSNLLFPDGEFDGVILFTPSADEIVGNGNLIEASGGASLAAIALRASRLSLGGMEFAAGIPGTLGGAVRMNAGAFGSSMAEVVRWVDCYNAKTSTVERLDAVRCGFGYRTSVFAADPHLTVIAAGMELFPREQRAIDALMEDYRRRRRASQPLDYPNAGSIFKNPEGDAAGRLIEACGLKGVSVGGAKVSERHANFIVNTGNASRQDVLELIKLIRARVLLETGIELSCELQDLESIAVARKNGL